MNYSFLVIGKLNIPNGVTNRISDPADEIVRFTS